MEGLVPFYRFIACRHQIIHGTDGVIRVMPSGIIVVGQGPALLVPAVIDRLAVIDLGSYHLPGGRLPAGAGADGLGLPVRIRDDQLQQQTELAAIDIVLPVEADKTAIPT